MQHLPSHELSSHSLENLRAECERRVSLGKLLAENDQRDRILSNGAEHGLEMDGVVLTVGGESSSPNHQAARTEAPVGMAMLRGSESILQANKAYQSTGADQEALDRIDASCCGLADMANIQPLLTNNMEALINSLDAWTQNVNKEVDALQSNSALLQSALNRFSEDLPRLKAGVQRWNEGSM